MNGRAFSIRRADAADADALARLHLRTVLTAYAGLFPADASPPDLDELRTDWRRTLLHATTTAFAAEAGGEIVGSVVADPDRERARCGQLRRLHVDPARWGDGIGSVLHDAAVEALTVDFGRAELWVLEGNTRARGMYERRGWTLVPDRRLEWPGIGVIELRYGRELRPF